MGEGVCVSSIYLTDVSVTERCADDRCLFQRSPLLDRCPNGRGCLFQSCLP